MRSSDARLRFPGMHAVAWVIGSLLMWAPPAAAQSARELAAARALFEQGVAATREGRWDDAGAAFERSYAIAARPSTLLNLAGVQARRGRLVEASEAYRRVLTDAERGERGQRLRDQATTELEGLLPRLAHVTIRLREPARPGDAFLLDDAPLNAALVGIDTPMDPGDHVVVLLREGAPAGRASFTAQEGRRADVLLAAFAPAVAAAIPPVVAPETRPAPVAIPADTAGSDVGVEPWVWAVVGVAAAGAIAGAVAGGVLASSPSMEPHQGNLGDGQLRF